MRATEYSSDISCKTIRNGHMRTPLRAELRFNDAQPTVLTLSVFSNFNVTESWTLSVDMFERLCGKRWSNTTIRIIDDGTTLQVIKVLSMVRKQVAVDFDIKGKPATRALIPLWEARRFMRVIKRARRTQKKVQHKYAQEGITQFEEYLANKE
jgi:hypothetical protein